MTSRLVVVMTGASGVAYGIRALELLREHTSVETHLVVTRAARATVRQETDMSVQDVHRLADNVHADHDLGSPISSGSFRFDGVLVAPCSVKTLSGIANAYDDTLAVRACDVALKERRRVVLLLRETPLHLGHLRLMSEVTQSGAVVMPPVPALYTRPTSLAEVIDHTVGRALDLFDIAVPGMKRWGNDSRTAGDENLPAPPGRGHQEPRRR